MMELPDFDLYGQGRSSQRGCNVVIDFHTHILPGIDDGSRDTGMTEAMLREEKRQGVELVVATPHFYANRTSIDAFLSRREAALEKTERVRREAAEALPEIMTGAEVYYFQGMGRADGVSRLVVGDTRTLLLEMPFEQWKDGMLTDVEDLIRKQKLNIVLAHIERYWEFQRDRRVWNRVFDLPLTPQINAGSFIKKRGLFHSDKKRRFCMDFLAEHPRLIVGSDCHNMEGRVPNMAGARAAIETELGAGALKDIEKTTREALGL